MTARAWFEELDPIFQALLAGGFTWLVTALGASLVFLTRTVSRRLLDAMLGFAAGVMIAASVWSLLLPAIDLAEAQGVQLRTLQRRFLRQLGVSPKRLARIVRFHHVCLAWRKDPEGDPATLARVAADCGYFDESHLVRDFRAFVGEPPASFLRSLSPFTSHFL